MKLLTILLFIFSFNLFAFPAIPNSNMTPGDYCTITSPDFREYRYAENVVICNRNVLYETKTIVYNAYNIPLGTRAEYTIDHLIPLCMGGSNDISNLWPQHKSISSANLEYDYYLLLRDGMITQADSIKIILDFKLKKSFI